MANMNEALKPFIENYQHFSSGVLDTINLNQEVFSSISDTFKPIQSIIENAHFINPIVDSGLTDVLSTIENTKSMIFSGQNLDYLTSGIVGSNELFIDASSKLAENYQGIELSDNISSFIINKSKEEENCAQQWL
jgi:hypothetical protein